MRGLERTPEKSGSGIVGIVIFFFILLLVFLGFALGFGEEFTPFRCAGLGELERFASREVTLALDPSFQTNRAGAQRVFRPNREVAVLARLKRADAVIDTQLFRRIDRDEVERLRFLRVAVLNRLGGLKVEAAREVGRVGVERHHHAALMHQAAGVRDGVDDLVLVCPPVGETGTTSAVGGDFVSHLVALEDMLQRADPDAEFLHRAHEGEDFILPIRVAVNPALARDDLPERLQLKVAFRWRTAFWPPIGLAEPCNRLATVSPPASWRGISGDSELTTSPIETIADEGRVPSLTPPRIML